MHGTMDEGGFVDMDEELDVMGDCARCGRGLVREDQDKISREDERDAGTEEPPMRSGMAKRKRPFKPGEWVGLMGVVTAKHGDREVVVRVSGVHVTMPTAEIWHLDPPEKPKAKRRGGQPAA